MITKTEETTTALILSGQGYELTIAPEAEDRKQEMLVHAGSVTKVTSNDESADAQWVSRKLAQMRIEVEKSRKLVKEPVNRIGKLIDQTAKDFLIELEAEERRITKLVGDHAMEVARIKREKEEEERRAFEAARIAREEALAAQEAAEAAKAGKQGIASLIAAQEAAKAAEAARVETLATRMDASAEVAGTKVAEGVRFAIDFEVENAEQFYLSAPALVKLEVKRAETLAWIKAHAETDPAFDQAIQNNAGCQITGLRVFKKPVVSSR